MSNGSSNILKTARRRTRTRALSAAIAGGYEMEFGSKKFEEIAEISNRIHALAFGAYFNPSVGSAGAKKAVQAKVEEITELLKGLPD